MLGQELLLKNKILEKSIRAINYNAYNAADVGI